MGYYRAVGRGDFYRGARGDPGFLSFLGGLGKTALSFIPGVGPIASKAAEVVSSAVERIGAKRVGSAAVDIVKAHPTLTAAGAAGVVGTAAGAMAGKHMGAPSAAGMAAAHAMRGGGGGGRRRMNPYNPRALRRALRRTHSFAKMARQIIRVSSHFKHPKRFKIGHFKKKSRK